MKIEQKKIDWAQVVKLPKEGTLVWTNPRFHSLVRQELGFNIISNNCYPPPNIPRLLVIGGGSLIDKSKIWRRNFSRNTWLCAVPSLWGSGAEISRFVVCNENDKKIPYTDDSFIPDAWTNWSPLIDFISPERARWGFGDVWAHALEGFLSPLASHETRIRARNILRDELLLEPFMIDEKWFELSTKACQIQIDSGVGLVHGIAHELELLLPGFDHSRLCATLLWPVFSYNCTRGSIVNNLMSNYDLSSQCIQNKIKSLFQPSDYEMILQKLKGGWNNIIRNRLTRINSTLVRADSLDFFLNYEFRYE